MSDFEFDDRPDIDDFEPPTEAQEEHLAWEADHDLDDFGSEIEAWSIHLNEEALRAARLRWAA